MIMMDKNQCRRSCLNSCNIVIFTFCCGLFIANVVTGEEGVVDLEQSIVTKYVETSTIAAHGAITAKPLIDLGDGVNAEKKSPGFQSAVVSSPSKDQHSSNLDDKNQLNYDGKDMKPTKDDWYYDPDEATDTNEMIWDDEDEKPQTDGLDSAHTDDEDDNIDDDDENDEGYDIWTKLQDKDDDDGDDEVLEPDDETRSDGDIDEKILEDVVEESLVKKNKLPTAPSKMVLFYTWMILVVLIMVISISTYQARCKGFHITVFRHQTRDDRKRLVDHEYT